MNNYILSFCVGSDKATVEDFFLVYYENLCSGAPQYKPDQVVDKIDGEEYGPIYGFRVDDYYVKVLREPYTSNWSRFPFFYRVEFFFDPVNALKPIKPYEENYCFLLPMVHQTNKTEGIDMAINNSLRFEDLQNNTGNLSELEVCPWAPEP